MAMSKELQEETLKQMRFVINDISAHVSDILFDFSDSSKVKTHFFIGAVYSLMSPRPSYKITFDYNYGRDSFDIGFWKLQDFSLYKGEQLDDIYVDEAARVMDEMYRDRKEYEWELVKSE